MYIHIHVCMYIYPYYTNIKYHTNVHPWLALSNRTLNIVLRIETTTTENINEHDSHSICNNTKN